MPSETANDPSCGICAVSTGAREVPHGILYQDDLWVVRHSAPPYGVAGWLTLMTRRHCPEPASFNDEEARSFGPTLRYFEGVLREITGALRIYTAAMGESFPHFHGHMVPRYAETPGDVKTCGRLPAPAEGGQRRDHGGRGRGEADLRGVQGARGGASRRCRPDAESVSPVATRQAVARTGVRGQAGSAVDAPRSPSTRHVILRYPMRLRRTNTDEKGMGVQVR